MNVVFVGGGSFRTLPIVRAAMSGKNVLRNGKIWLVDFNLERAETVGKLIMRTPECAASNCKIGWTKNIDEALPGADLVSISFPVGSYEVCSLSTQACHKHGFYGTDQLSLSGAFRSLTGGTIILGIARRMEKYCPKAWLVTHANPVAVYSGLVNNHTRIKALGLCGSCYHPHWDFTRLLYEKNEYNDNYKISSAGVNHLTFVIHGEHKGRNIGKLLDQKYGNKPWKPRLAGVSPAGLKTLHFSYSLFRRMWKSFGVLPCSNELEGEYYVFPDEYTPPWTTDKPLTISEIRLKEKKSREDRMKQDKEFRAHLDRELSPAFWAKSSLENPNFGAMHSETTAVVIKALGGEPQKLAASLPNRGAIKAIKDRNVAEYSFTLDKKGVHPDAGLEIPDCFHGLITSLATHQTLLGDAVATRDPKILSDALFAFPLQQGSDNARSLWKELLKIHAKEIPVELQKAKDYFA